MTASVLQVSPDELRSAARALRGIGTDVETLGARLLGAAPSGSEWAGVAALQQRARSESLRALIRTAARPPEQVAGVVERYAAVAEEAADEVRRWRRRADDALDELARLREVGPPPEPDLVILWRRRVEELQTVADQAVHRLRQTEEEFGRHQDQAARAVTDAAQVIADVKAIVAVPQQALKAVRQTVATSLRLVHTTELALALARARWASGAAARAVALSRARGAFARLQQLSLRSAQSPLLRRMRLVPGPSGMAIAWWTAWSDARTGGGYAGWRGQVTRVTAVGALVGGPLALLTPVFAPAGMVGIGLLSIYQGWMAGNAVWDGVGAAVRYARRYGPLLGDLRDRARAAAQRAGVRLAQVREQVRQLPGRVRTEVGQRVRDVGEIVVPLLRQAPDGQTVREWWRQVGSPIRLPATPLGPSLPSLDLGRLRP